ncbi:hypothetical protein [Pseudomonas sp. N040]|uniref:hypothetical protein n=1 Tax=Pseudomonas sp. N040 TaxID=2785325 RepID=UPI0018A29789|nr:hypothetical protein [Pseudomonas sp. N040]MBF7729848.1 hypothetical protein [Pseudomonas sp. N040]MBW7013490.1 hypothetical protein [Pseudomonas sp. N040]
MSDANVLIIWGMHRSGTSLLASWLAACGLDVGQELLGSGVGNERGHHEDIDFLQLHENILKDNRIRCGGLLRTEPLLVSAQRLAEMRDLVGTKAARGTQWGWKEPRTCLFHREYQTLLPDANHLLVFRDYRLVVDSLVRRRMKKREQRIGKKRGLKKLYYRSKASLWRLLSMPRAAERYLRAWVRYNENLLELAANAADGKLFVLDCSDFVAVSPMVRAWLCGAGFSISPEPAEAHVDRSMIAIAPRHEYRFSADLQKRADSILANMRDLAERSRQMAAKGA